MKLQKLTTSIPANNQKIIELYNKIKNQELDPSPNFQRKLVWKKQHKIKFIDTILNNYPFPEIYIAPAGVDIEQLKIKDLIVDGQQRLTTIVNYIEGTDVFAVENLPITSFESLNKAMKTEFLNYEVSVRYLKNVDEKQIKEVFQRINDTEYGLNSTERINAQWGDSEFICFAKQLVEKDLDVDSRLISHRFTTFNRKFFVTFFHQKNSIFTENDVNRMFALQYGLTLIATICEQEYFRRNDKVQEYIEKYYDEFVDAGIVEESLFQTLQFIDSLELEKGSYWFNKANIFSLIIELYKFDKQKLSKKTFKNLLLEVDKKSREYIVTQQKVEWKDLFDMDDTNEITITKSHSLPSDYVKYFEFAKEAVNNKVQREYRGSFIKTLITKSLNP